MNVKSINYCSCHFISTSGGVWPIQFKFQLVNWKEAHSSLLNFSRSGTWNGLPQCRHTCVCLSMINDLDMKVMRCTPGEHELPLWECLKGLEGKSTTSVLQTLTITSNTSLKPITPTQQTPQSVQNGIPTKCDLTLQNDNCHLHSK